MIFVNVRQLKHGTERAVVTMVNL